MTPQEDSKPGRTRREGNITYIQTQFATRVRSAIISLAKREAREAIKRKLRAEGTRVTLLTVSEINRLADAHLRAHATELLAKAEASGTVRPRRALWSSRTLRPRRALFPLFARSGILTTRCKCQAQEKERKNPMVQHLILREASDHFVKLRLASLSNRSSIRRALAAARTYSSPFLSHRGASALSPPGPAHQHEGGAAASSTYSSQAGRTS